MDAGTGAIEQALPHRPQSRGVVIRTGREHPAIGAERDGLYEGENPSVCSKTAICLPLAISHTRAVVSREPVATVRPSGLKATELTPLVWPLRQRSPCPWPRPRVEQRWPKNRWPASDRRG